MTSPIKISDHTKRSLDKMSRKLLLNYDLKFTQQEIIDLLIKFGESNFELFLEPKMKPKTGVFDKIKRLQRPWKIETNPELIDDMLYRESELYDISLIHHLWLD